MKAKTHQRAVLYVRVSVDDVKKGKMKPEELAKDASISIRSQVLAARNLANLEGLTIVKELVDDGVSGHKQGVDRKGFRTLIGMIDRREVDALIVRHADRAGRNDVDNSALRIASANAGIIWYQLNGPKVDPRQSGGRLMLQVQQGIAEYQSTVKSEQLRNTYEGMRANGTLRSTTKVFGWKWEKKNPQVAMRADPHARRIIQDAYRRVAAGESLYSVVQLWNADPTVSPIRSAKSWSYASVRAVLLRPSNAGFVRAGDGWDYLPDVRGKWEVLVDEPTFIRVREILTNPARRTNPGRKSKYLGSGIVRCGVCGGVLRSSSVAGKGPHEPARIPIYRCTSKLSFVADPGVRHVSARIEDGITAKRKRTVLGLDTVIRSAVVAAIALGPNDLFPEAISTDTDSLYTELEEALERRQELTSGVAEGLYKIADIRASLSNLNGAEKALTERISAAKASNLQGSVISDLRAGLLIPGRQDLTAFSKYKNAIGRNFDELDVGRKRELVRALLSITVLPLAPGQFGERRWQVIHKVVLSLNDQENGV